MKQLPLSAGWQLKERTVGEPLGEEFSSETGWHPATVPGTVHQDLIAAGRIPDPFVGLNELDVQWVGERDWLYRCRFDLPAGFREASTVALCFDGLDTFATVWLNGQRVLVADNMFVPRRVPVGSLLRAGTNELWLLFESALRRGKALEATYGVSRVWNGDASRVYVRKAQYHYGWDWGPTLLTAGPWREIRLEAYDARIADLHCPVEVGPDLGDATLPVTVAVEDGAGRAPLTLRLALYGPEGELVDSALVPVEAGRAHHTFRVENPRLWWPRGYGEQPLYRLVATLAQDRRELDRQTLRLGLRRLRLLQEPLADEPGTSFVFEVNNHPLFCGGVNWIPADSFTPRLTAEKYRALLRMAADAHVLMVRVWGGGIYEEDLFYDTCDELGLLVWQDFMFACGLYPAHEAFQTTIRAEAEATVRRLRHHPSLALWCGNNEDYQLAHSLGRYPPSGDDPARAFPARELYERLLPEICAALDPSTPYWPGSPFGGANPNDQTVGDRHTWEVWHGPMAPYRDYPRYGGRFVSEFGMQALPAVATIEAFAEPSERHPASRTLDHHNKAEGGPRRLALYLSDTLRAPADLDGAVYASQLVQAEALGTAIRGWRRRFGGDGRQAVAGALIWQLDDCWPATSWAIIDYLLRPKAAYYVVARELAPLVVGLAPIAGGAAVWAVNGTFHALDAELQLSTWTPDGRPGPGRRRRVTLPPNQATELGRFTFERDRFLVIGARLLVEGRAVGRATLWPEPYKYLTLPDPGLEIKREGETLRLRVARPAKGVWLSAGDEVQWSDNLLDLLPGDEQVVTARGLGRREVHVRCLNEGSLCPG